ncbi:QueT transporter family protein [Acutalibacter intestini]|uniref:QueT transporter family protein n=1 Tax=Acutalibacter intestini TaxID=3093659 RepID=UPI002AC96E13|nr:QueT transporter family protein [Acutalibacter sp. M00204]
MQSRQNFRSAIVYLALGAVIAALYVILTYVSAALNLAYGPVQFRISEALTVLPAFTPAAVPGLALGCFISNLASPLGIVDWVFGTAATLLAALGTAALGHIRYKDLPLLAPLPPVLVNALVVGLELACLSSTGAFAWGNFSLTAFGAGALSVGLGELVVCYALGLPLMIALQRAGLADLLARAGGRESL